ncbi:transmembrane protein 179 [Galendromus occidentalis]|uniref:Transmembrane protein 179 n=1 Tax=Galendromus occidentalis TaxID=34638 RepID=A0AAJ7PA84_9ACAR|nr:transmembrane protein 179 [Galendromus occidentalis]
MSLGNIPLLAQATVCSLTLLLSMAALIPMSWHVSNFKGHCLLYTNGTFDNNDGHFIPDWGSSFYCYYSIIINVAIVLMSMLHLVKYGVMHYQSRDSNFLGAFFDCVVSVALTSLLFISSVFVSDGFRTWCAAIEQRFPGCEEASVTEIDPGDGIDTVGFYVMMGAIQFAQWTCWVCWILQSVLSIRKLCIYHERENIIVSMARERQNLHASQKDYSLLLQSNTQEAPDDDNNRRSDVDPILS